MSLRPIILGLILLFTCLLHNQVTAGERPAGYNPLKNVYVGDLHVHTRLSFDAFLFQTRNSPDDAYRYAKGEPLRPALVSESVFLPGTRFRHP